MKIDGHLTEGGNVLVQAKDLHDAERRAKLLAEEAKAALLHRLRQIDPTVELVLTIHDEFEITCAADRRERVLAFMREWRWPDA